MTVFTHKGEQTGDFVAYIYRQLGKNPQNKVITGEPQDLIDKLLSAKILLTGIARVVDASEGWRKLWQYKTWNHCRYQCCFIFPESTDSLTFQKRSLSHPNNT